VSGIDIMPTIMDILQLEKPKMDGESYLKTLQTGVDFKNEVYTCLCRLFSGKPFETRAVHNKEYCYIKNFWSNGKQMFTEDGSLDNNLSVQGIIRTDDSLYRKLRFRSYEEIYNIQEDPFACKNIVDLNKKITMNKLINKYSLIYNDKIAQNNVSKTLNFLI
jgi:arylsulfatase A-like enzyme